MVSLTAILFNTKCFFFVYKDYIDLLKLKAYKLNLKLVMLTSPGVFFKEANLFNFGVSRDPVGSRPIDTVYGIINCFGNDLFFFFNNSSA